MRVAVIDTTSFRILASMVLLVNGVVSNIVQFQFGALTRRDSDTNANAPGGTFYYAPSVIACARLCFDHDNYNCDNFVWDPNSKNCSVGPEVNDYSHETSTPAALDHVISYSKTFNCFTSLGFVLRVAGLSPMCVRVMTERKNRTGAEASCKSLHGSLVIVDTQSKIDFMAKMAKETFKTSNPENYGPIGIGCDYVAVKEVFVWVDGRTLSSREVNKFFLKQYLALRTWVCLYINFQILSALENSWEYPYACEIDISHGK